MPVTLRDLVAVAELGLVPVAGAAGLDREVTWVHGSEVEDPTPWLSGGELLLTTGMRLGEPGLLAGLCARLADAGAAGIGFATGVTSDEVPAELVDAADRHGLAVVEVPYETPFVAIAKTVANALAEHQHAALRTALDSHRGLVAAALADGGVPGVAGKLAALLDGWCVVTDAATRVTAAEPAAAVDRLAEVADDLDRLHSGEVDSVGSVRPDQHVVMHRLGGGGRSRGFLVAGRRKGFGAPEQTVVAAAASVLGLVLEQLHSAAVRARRMRGELVVQLVHDRGTPETVRGELRDHGLDGDELRVLVLVPPTGVDPAGVVDDVDEELEHRGELALVGHDEGWVVAVTADAAPMAAVLSATCPDGAVGVSAAAGVGRLEPALRQAMLAARADGEGGVTYADHLDAVGLLMNLQESGVLDVFVGRVLAPLSGQDGLLDSLRAFLDHHGSWHAAAAELGVHRHTVRARLERVEELLGRSLDAADVRLELGLALRARDLLGS